MRLHFLGTTGYHPNRRRDTACLMLPSEGIILDAGTGIFRARDLIETGTLDIFLSHVHLDHCVGLTFLLDVLYDRNVRQVRVFVAPEKHEAIERHLFDEAIFPLRPPFELLPLDQTPVELRHGGTLKAFPVEHPGGCLAFRLDWPNGAALDSSIDSSSARRSCSLAYVTDTTASREASYIEQIRGVDCLVHECYFPDGLEDRAALTGHSCLTPVAELAKACAARQTWLVHLNPLLERESDFDISAVLGICPNLKVPEDGQLTEF